MMLNDQLIRIPLLLFGENVRPIGTAFAVSHNRARYLITAAHVASLNPSEVLLPEASVRSPLSASWINAGSSDLAATTLADSFPVTASVPLSEISDRPGQAGQSVSIPVFLTDDRENVITHPLIRFGRIAHPLMPARLRVADRTFEDSVCVIDAMVWPGYSGAPVFVEELDNLRLIGIIQGHKDEQKDVFAVQSNLASQTSFPPPNAGTSWNASVNLNSGLSFVTEARHIKSIVSSLTQQ